MDKNVRVAIPSMKPGGVDAYRSGHFGRCDCFTVVEINGEEQVSTSVVENLPHSEGGCLQPVNLLASHGVNAVVVGGIGLRPLEGFRAAGIEVYLGVGDKVGQSVEAFMKGKLPVITEEGVCGGH